MPKLRECTIAHENLRFVREKKYATLRGLFTVEPDGEMQERPLKGFPRDFISATDLNVYGESASLLQLAFRHQPVEGETYDYRIFVDTDERVQ